MTDSWTNINKYSKVLPKLTKLYIENDVKNLIKNIFFYFYTILLYNRIKFWKNINIKQKTYSNFLFYTGLAPPSLTTFSQSSKTFNFFDLFGCEKSNNSPFHLEFQKIFFLLMFGGVVSKMEIYLNFEISSYRIHVNFYNQ